MSRRDWWYRRDGWWYRRDRWCWGRRRRGWRGRHHVHLVQVEYPFAAWQHHLDVPCGGGAWHRERSRARVSGDVAFYGGARASQSAERVGQVVRACRHLVISEAYAAAVIGVAVVDLDPVDVVAGPEIDEQPRIGLCASFTPVLCKDVIVDADAREL